MITRDYLFTTWEGGGNVPPTLGAVRRLVARGHRVRVLAEDAMRGDIEAAGGSFVPWRRAPNRPDRAVATDFLRDWEGEGPGGDLMRLLDQLVFGPAAAYAADTADELRRQPADVVVCCDLLFGPMIAAEIDRHEICGVLAERQRVHAGGRDPASRPGPAATGHRDRACAGRFGQRVVRRCHGGAIAGAECRTCEIWPAAVGKCLRPAGDGRSGTAGHQPRI